MISALALSSGPRRLGCAWRESPVAAGVRIETPAPLLKDGFQVGTAVFGTTVWVDCQQDTGFNPGDGGGSLWYRIRWPNVNATTQPMNSSPGSPFTAWVYGRYAVPAGHNGHVPTC